MRKSEKESTTIDFSKNPSYSGEIKYKENADMSETKILICDDHPLFRYGLRTLLEKESYLILEATDASSGIEAASHTVPDLIIMDYLIPGMNGLKTIEAIRTTGLEIPAVLLTNMDEPELLKKCKEMGFRGYFSKNESLEAISHAVTRVLNGNEVFIEPDEGGGNTADGANPFNCLTKREIEVVREVATGKSHRQIAEILGISTRTVEKHRENISQKLGKISLAELTKKAFIWGLIRE